MDESHRSPAASTGGDPAGATPTPPSAHPSGNDAGHPHDASSPWAAPGEPASTGSTSASSAPSTPAPGGPMPPTPRPPASGTFTGHPRPAPHPGAPHAGPGHTAALPVGPGQVPPVPPQPTGPHMMQPHPTGPFPTWSVGGTQTAPLPTAARPRRGGRLAGAIVGGALILALVAGGTGAAVGVAVSDHAGGGITIGQDDSPAATASSTNGSVEAASAKVLKSVVTIEVSGSQESGTGSGIVLDSSGHILTNNHVVEAATDGGSIRVTLADGSRRSATIVGRDPTSDIAVIKVSDAGGLTPATFAASSTVRTGQTVIAVGAPLGLSNTVTEGIVSALNRPVRTGDSSSQNTVIDAVQTDAAINPGNSGGALADLSGRVIGINSAIASVSDTSQGSQSGNIGVGFAIPADTALKVAAQLIQDGTAEHAALGVTAQDTQDETGAQVQTVSTGSAAAKAGIRTGDVITAIDKRAVTGTDGLVAAVRSHDPGNTVSVTYERGGKSTTVKVTLTSSAT